jgi:hypothetical protein
MHSINYIKILNTNGVSPTSVPPSGRAKCQLKKKPISSAKLIFEGYSVRTGLLKLRVKIRLKHL